MTWDVAVAHAIRRWLETGRRHYVRGFRRVPNGEWRYGVYRQDRPPLCSRGWCNHWPGACDPGRFGDLLGRPTCWCSQRIAPHPYHEDTQMTGAEPR